MLEELSCTVVKIIWLFKLDESVWSKTYFVCGSNEILGVSTPSK